MSYVTDFELTWEPKSPEVAAAIAGLDAGIYAGAGAIKHNTATWYDHERDLAAVSRQFPAVLFRLKGHGESALDFWIDYFLGGRMQRCGGMVGYEPFDPACLVEVEAAVNPEPC